MCKGALVLHFSEMECWLVVIKAMDDGHLKN